jgi:hypothetical protein
MIIVRLTIAAFFLSLLGHIAMVWTLTSTNMLVLVRELLALLHQQCRVRGLVVRHSQHGQSGDVR